MIKNNKGFTPILILVVIGIVLAGGLYLITIKNKKYTSGIHGTVTLRTGNCMPGIVGLETGPDLHPCVQTKISRKIYVYLPSKIDFKTDEKTLSKLIRTTQSDSEGNYKVDLPPGDYSVLVDDNGEKYCNRFSLDKTLCLVQVGTDFQLYNIEINHAAW